MKYWVGLILTAALLGCASEPAKETAHQGSQVTDAEQQICHREVPTGTNLAVTRCRTLSRIEQERQAARDATSQVGRTSGTATSPSGR
jgi:hypothetical protein